VRDSESSLTSVEYNASQVRCEDDNVVNNSSFVKPFPNRNVLTNPFSDTDTLPHSEDEDDCVES
jgi:hypothetical protein